MRRFSERHGLVDVDDAIQRGYISERLRNRLWSLCGGVFWSHLEVYVDDSDFTRAVQLRIQDHFFGQPVDALSFRSKDNLRVFRGWAFNARWNEFYDFIQFLADFSKFTEGSEPFRQMRMHGEIFITECNEILEKERAAYRFVNGELCEITDEGEIKEIEEALRAPDVFAGARTHLSTALRYYAERDAPDYRNSIKEAISAIESAFQVINGKRSGSLGDALRLAEKNGFILHPALRNGILSIYGWTSDEQGIRHALFDGAQDIGEPQARLMLVLCSALLNFLILKSQNA